MKDRLIFLYDGWKTQEELKAKISRVKLSGREEENISDVSDETQLRQEGN